MLRSSVARALIAVFALVPLACGGSTDATDSGGSGGAAGSGGSDASGDVAGAPPDAGDASVDASVDAPTKYLTCADDPPPGAPQADPLPTYAGTCPQLVAAPTENTITTSGKQRQFLLAIPKDLKPDEKLPVIFLWHWLGGSGSDFYDKGDVQNAVDTQRFLAVMPESEGATIFGISGADVKWPFDVTQTQARMDEEFQFFDDMLACVAAAFPTVNKNCVASAGVSAGALFTDQLAAARSTHLSSFLSLSGGVGAPTDTPLQVIRPWGNPSHVLPGLVLWGGPSDVCATIHFATESANLENALIKNGNFFVECVHNCAHAEPPFEAPAGLSTYAGLWQFVFDHPYWLAPGDSPYKTQGIPASDPAWCGIGQGSATPRTGTCPPPACPF